MLLNYIALSAILVIAVLLLILMHLNQRGQRKTHIETLKMLSENLHQSSELLREAGKREERLTNLLSSKDPMTYQMLTAMGTSSGYDGPTYDPSQEAEDARIRERSPGLIEHEEALNGLDQSVLTELFGANPGSLDFTSYDRD